MSKKSTFTLRSGNKPSSFRAMGASPAKDLGETIKEVIGQGAKQVGKKVLKKGLQKAGAKVLSRAVAPVGLVMGAKEVFDGYGELAKTKHGKQIIKDY